MNQGATGLSGRLILVVEDDYLIVDDMLHSLRSRQARIAGPAATVADALAVIECTSAIDAAVLDINLRGERVFPVAEVLIERGVPFIFATGYDTAQIPERFAGFPTCKKPVTPERILSTLTRSLDGTSWGS